MIVRKVCKHADEGYGQWTVNYEKGPEVDDDVLKINFRKQVNPGEFDTQQICIIIPKDENVKLIYKDVIVK